MTKSEREFLTSQQSMQENMLKVQRMVEGILHMAESYNELLRGRTNQGWNSARGPEKLLPRGIDPVDVMMTKARWWTNHVDTE